MHPPPSKNHRLMATATVSIEHPSCGSSLQPPPTATATHHRPQPRTTCFGHRPCNPTSWAVVEVVHMW
ncbi:hypothetical protein QJS10_CPB18g00418 [Acorus calamus]|uniref:Uncharacterized protein n=1 Tax=Acorus calamus TaxID=4465 RepID=A0AAV9CRP9_ACOCL|nr:hypothetical protein QJS10_CPB18g00418 [Acorus calamus]